MWTHLIKAATALAEQYDESWQKRQRVLNTLIVMLFIFRWKSPSGKRLQ